MNPQRSGIDHLAAARASRGPFDESLARTLSRRPEFLQLSAAKDAGAAFDLKVHLVPFQDIKLLVLSLGHDLFTAR